MKKIVLVAFLLLFFSPLLKQNIAEAITQQASRLDANASCTTGNTGINDQSTITFTWFDSGAQGNYGFKFWKTGDSSETVVDKSASCFNYACKIVATSLPQNKTYDWYVKTYDTGFCLFGCDTTVNGPSVTSITCPPVTPITTYACDNTLTCVLSPTGKFQTYQDCKAACVQPTTPAYNCANRSAECSSLTTYPNSICFDFPFSSNWKCPVPPNCAMNYRVGLDSSKWTNSCAFNITQPTSCQPLGSTTCTGGLAPDDCCAGSTCQPPSPDHTALGNGTCVASGPNLNTCYICANAWSDNLNSCVDSSGNKTNPLTTVNCGTTQTCFQGKGCIAPTPLTGGDNPYNAPTPTVACAQALVNGNCPSVSTAFGNISTNTAGFVKAIFGLVLSLVGGLAVLLIILSGYRLATSQGNPDRIKQAQEQLTAAIIGLLFAVFSLVFLETIGVDILGIPGFGK